jgi:hypothetical protein
MKELVVVIEEDIDVRGGQGHYLSISGIMRRYLFDFR